MKSMERSRSYSTGSPREAEAHGFFINPRFTSRARQEGGELADGIREERDNTLVTHNSLCGVSRAKIFLVTIISFVVAILVVLLVILTRIEKVQPSPQPIPSEEECPEVAIIGAGVAGTYAAWRMRSFKASVSIYEMTNRAGGRLYTRTFPNMTDVNLEMGEMYFMPSVHTYTQEIVQEMGLNVTHIFPNLGEQDILYHLRGLNLSPLQLNSSGVPYNLRQNEKDTFPRQLLRQYLSKLANISDYQGHPLELLAEDGIPLFKKRSHNALLQVASAESYRFLRDTMAPREFHPAGSAAMFVSSLEQYDTEEFQDLSQYVTITQGMQRLPEALLRGFLEMKNHSIVYNHKLLAVYKSGDKYTLVFQKTDTLQKEDPVSICAKSIILAIPRFALKDVDMSGISAQNYLSAHLDDVIDVPDVKMFLAYHDKSWGKVAPAWRFARSDLPIKSTLKVGTSEQSDKVVFMTTLNKEQFSDYWESIDQRSHQKTHQNDTTMEYPSKIFLSHLNIHFLELIQNTSSFPSEPNVALMQNWGEYPYGGLYHIWKPDVNWTDVSDNMLKPAEHEAIYIVGSSFTEPPHQQWPIEGALRTVENMFKKYFPKL